MPQLKKDLMRKRRPLLQAEVELAISKTQSAKAASRFLGVSYNTFKKYATMYCKQNRGKWRESKTTDRGCSKNAADSNANFRRCC